MARIRKLKSNNIVNSIETVLNSYIKEGDHIAAALSGGVDSIVLLDLLNTFSKSMNFTLSAIHVNHGISRNAEQWYQFCCNLCRSLHIPITIKHLRLVKESCISLEAAARHARYQAFIRLPTNYVVLGQHQDDQAETLLLQLLRGAGTRGLAGMPTSRKQGADNAPEILRPMLDVPRDWIVQYAKEKQLSWINDESNEDILYDRNFLRHKILPILKKRYPSYATTFLRASRHLAEASHLLDELAMSDGKECMIEGKIQIQYLRQLSIARAKNLLRYTLSLNGINQPSTKKISDVIRQLFMAGTNAKLNIPFGKAEFRCYKGSIYILPRKTAPEDNDFLLAWRGEKQLALRQLNGSITFSYKRDKGINLDKLNKYLVTIRSRAGGERFRPDCKRPRRKLKNLLQEACIPTWERNILPLLFCGEQLIWVPDIGVECGFQTTTGNTGLVPTWEPDKSKFECLGD